LVLEEPLERQLLVLEEIHPLEEVLRPFFSVEVDLEELQVLELFLGEQALLLVEPLVVVTEVAQKLTAQILAVAVELEDILAMVEMENFLYHQLE
jgi:hypothetical protein